MLAAAPCQVARMTSERQVGDSLREWATFLRARDADHDSVRADRDRLLTELANLCDAVDFSLDARAWTPPAARQRALAACSIVARKAIATIDNPKGSGT